eukprot:TRINITY_DN5222_c0_g1_i1.p1 TRINITY_DN5222_c0_g1~~TRINITY_DN5222_c0_g1_i1.p1  ORF type:complete len:194 (+),score=15.41 TRINITY_DN5222_c0_g1_i1:86-583(+)
MWDYLTIFLTTLAELPGLLVSSLLVEKMGRKKTLAINYAICGLCTLALISNPGRIVGTVLLVIARAAIMGSFACSWAYTPEVYPTEIRATALGLCSAVSKISAIFTPFIPSLLTSIGRWIPPIVFSSFCLLSVVASIMLPYETKGQKMVESDQDKNHPNTNSSLI